MERVRAATSPHVRRRDPQITMSRSGTVAAMTSWTAGSDHSPGAGGVAALVIAR